MTELLVSAAAFILWIVVWTAAALVLTPISMVLGALLERYGHVAKRWTRLLWVGALASCPACAFWGSWTLLGLLVPGRLYLGVRYGGVAAGVLFAVLGVTVVTKTGGETVARGELAALVGSLFTCRRWAGAELILGC